MDYQAFIQEYKSYLNDLTFNSKALINTLTMLASENIPAATSIQRTIEDQIILGPQPCKLPSLYLLDSIVKNVGRPYTLLFAQRLPEVFIAVWDALPQVQRPALLKVLKHWEGVFAPNVLLLVSQRTQQANVPVYGALPVVPAVQPQSAGLGHVPAPVYHPHQAVPQVARAPNLPVVLPPPVMLRTGEPMIPLSRITAPTANSLSQSQVPQQAMQRGHPNQPAPSYPVPPSGVQTQVEAPLSSFLAHPPPVGPAPVAPAPVAPAPVELPAFLNELLQAGAIKLPGAPASDNNLPKWPDRQGPPAAQKGGSGRERPNGFDLPQGLQRSLARLKVSSERLRVENLDRQFEQRRRQRLNAGRPMSRQWFVDADAWLSGTTADSHTEPDFFGNVPAPAQDRNKDTVTADVEQTHCAVSGEKFEIYWDDDLEEWRYKSAVKLDADQARRLGVSEGSLVKVGCLATTPEAPDHRPSGPAPLYKPKVPQQAAESPAVAPALPDVVKPEPAIAPTGVVPHDAHVKAEPGTTAQGAVPQDVVIKSEAGTAGPGPVPDTGSAAQPGGHPDLSRSAASEEVTGEQGEGPSSKDAGLAASRDAASEDMEEQNEEPPGPDGPSGGEVVAGAASLSPISRKRSASLDLGWQASQLAAKRIKVEPE
eukprot:jgi/Botrbrau1/11977/Bobra.0115s0013.1